MEDDDIVSNFRTNFKDKSKEDILTFIENSYTDENINLAIVNEDDEYIGTISIKNINYIDKNGEYAIVLRRQAIGTGIAEIATFEILDIAFNKLKLQRVYLNVYSENSRAIKFYKKIGFRYEGEFKKHILLKDKFKDLMWFAILKEEHRHEI